VGKTARGCVVGATAALLAAVVPESQAGAAQHSTQTVASDGITLSVPAGWRVVPYGEGYAGCPSPKPVLQTNVPTTAIASSCPAISLTEATSVAAVGVIQYPQAYAGSRQRINGLPTRLAVNEFPTTLSVQAFFPMLETQVGLSFFGLNAEKHKAEALEIVQSVRPAKAPVYGLVTPPPGLRTRLSVDAGRIVAGGELKGTLIVTNTTKTTVNLTDSTTSGCQPAAAIALVSPSWLPPQADFVASCLGAPKLIPPGTTRWRVSGFAGYDPCGFRALWSVPSTSCSGGQHALPRGHYRAVLVGQDLPLPAPRAISVTVS
jgi:hypothetical protein